MELRIQNKSNYKYFYYTKFLQKEFTHYYKLAEKLEKGKIIVYCDKKLSKNSS